MQTGDEIKMLMLKIRQGRLNKRKNRKGFNRLSNLVAREVFKYVLNKQQDVKEIQLKLKLLKLYEIKEKRKNQTFGYVPPFHHFLRRI